MNIWCFDSATQAFATLTRRMRPVLNKLRQKARGHKPKREIKYERRRRYKYKASYLKVQETMNYIELERILAANRRKQEKLYPKPEFVDDLGILEAPDEPAFPGQINAKELNPLVVPVPTPGRYTPPK